MFHNSVRCNDGFVLTDRSNILITIYKGLTFSCAKLSSVNFINYTDDTQTYKGKFCLIL